MLVGSGQLWYMKTIAACDFVAISSAKGCVVCIYQYPEATPRALVLLSSSCFCIWFGILRNVDLSRLAYCGV